MTSPNNDADGSAQATMWEYQRHVVSAARPAKRPARATLLSRAEARSRKRSGVREDPTEAWALARASLA
jgi:hypothetical protein